MKRVFFALVLSICAVGQETNLPTLTIGTNSYKNATIRKRNATEVIVRFDGGLTMVKIAELPEPIRTAWKATNVPTSEESLKNREAAQAEKNEQERVRQALIAKYALDQKPAEQAAPDVQPISKNREADDSSEMLGLAFLLFILAVYFVPSAVAHFRNHRNEMAIVTLNVLLGWTFLGWVVALVWALCQDRPRGQA